MAFPSAGIAHALSHTTNRKADIPLSQNLLSVGIGIQSRDNKVSERFLLGQLTAQDWFQRGREKNNNKEYRSAIVDFTKALQLSPDGSGSYQQRGFAKHMLGNLQGALEDYNQSIKISPNYFWTYYLRARARLGVGDKSGAVVDYGQVIQLSPKRPDAHLERGVIYYNAGNKQAAYSDYKAASQLYLQQGDQQSYQKALRYMRDAAR